MTHMPLEKWHMRHFEPQGMSLIFLVNTVYCAFFCHCYVFTIQRRFPTLEMPLIYGMQGFEHISADCLKVQNNT